MSKDKIRKIIEKLFCKYVSFVDVWYIKYEIFSFLNTKKSRPPQYVPNSILKFCQHVDANCKLMHFSTLDGILQNFCLLLYTIQDTLFTKKRLMLNEMFRKKQSNPLFSIGVSNRHKTIFKIHFPIITHHCSAGKIQ